MDHLQNDHNVVLITDEETITVEEMDESILEDTFEAWNWIKFLWNLKKEEVLTVLKAWL